MAHNSIVRVITVGLNSYFNRILQYFQYFLCILSFFLPIPIHIHFPYKMHCGLLTYGHMDYILNEGMKTDRQTYVYMGQAVNFTSSMT